MVWLSSSSGQFTVVSAQEEIRQKHNISWIDSFIWDSIVPLKVSFFVQRLLRDWVPLDSILQRKGLSIASRCTCCYSAWNPFIICFFMVQSSCNRGFVLFHQDVWIARLQCFKHLFHAVDVGFLRFEGSWFSHSFRPSYVSHLVPLGEEE